MCTHAFADSSAYLWVGREAHGQLPRGLHHQLVVRQRLAGLHDAHNRRLHVVSALLLHRHGQRLATQPVARASIAAIPAFPGTASFVR